MNVIKNNPAPVVVSYRLTNMDRSDIVERAMAFTFSKMEQDLKSLEGTLARAAYESVFPATIRKQAYVMPDGWLRRDGCLRFNVVGMDIRLNLEEGKEVPVPYNRQGCGRIGTIEAGELADKIQDFLARNEKLKKERHQLRHSLSAMLGQVNTLRALAAAWPQGQSFYECLNKEPAIRLPALQVSEINKMIGL